MNIALNPDYWLIAGVILLVAELILPGGIVMFLGAGCLIVALAVWSGLVSTWVGALTLFFITCILLIVTLRSFAMKFVGGDFSEGNTVEILDQVGELVRVVETIGPGNRPGRVDVRGTQWTALGDGRVLNPGEMVRIVSLQNVNYIVEKVDK